MIVSWKVFSRNVPLLLDSQQHLQKMVFFFFLSLTMGERMTTMPENLYMDWVDSAKVNWLHEHKCFFY